MVDHQNITWEETQDPTALKNNKNNYFLYSRDPCRTPFQWNSNISSGFSSNDRTWLPINPNYKIINAEAQISNPKSHIEIYRRLIKLRQHDTFVYGDIMLKAFNDNVFAYARFFKKSDTFIVVINLSGKKQTVDLTHFGAIVKDYVKVEMAQHESGVKAG